MLDEPIDPEFRAAALEDHSAEAAFVRSAGWEFAGHTLKPFSAMRFAAAQRLGLRFGLVNPDELDASGMYPGMVADAIIVGFLCAAADSIVMKAFRAPDVVMAEAMRWAEANGAGYGTPRMLELCQAFGEIMADLMTSTAAPAKSEGAALGN